LRIISGSLRGRKLNPPNGLPVRPTTDLAKESLFNILINKVDMEDISVLDLFAGTGSISVEFISRGAKDVVSVEINHRCHEFIKKTITDLGIRNQFAIKANVFQYLKTVKRKFDVIFADPPYDMKEVEGIPESVISHDLLNPEGWLIIEHDASHNFSQHPLFFEERKYGKVHFSFFQFAEKTT
jgi:16S rRNA (guanine966-N2)-methyltransferase